MVNEEEDTEAEVLNWWDRKKQWLEMGSAAAKAIKYGIWLFKFLFVTGTTAVVVGEVTDTTPLRNTAVEVGILDERKTDIIGNDAMYEELSNLIDDVERLEAKLADGLEHTHNYPDPVLVKHEHEHEHDQIAPVVVSEEAHTHKEYAEVNHTHDEIEALRKELRGHEHEMPPPVAGASDTAIDGALLEHIRKEH